MAGERGPRRQRIIHRRPSRRYTLISMNEPLPSFKVPPVVETALSVQFKPLPLMSNAHLGLFWREVRDEYPTPRDAGPIEPQVEEFHAEAAKHTRLPKFQIRTVVPPARLQMASRGEGHMMIQVQNGRLVYNWRCLDGGTYPSWDRVLPGFEDALARFQSFLQDEELGKLEPNQWEVTYVNHLLRGREWESPSDWGGLLPGLIGTASRLESVELETLSGNWHFVLPEKAGRLHVDIVHAFGGAEEDAKEFLVLQLTGRGKVAAEEGTDLVSGLNIGHKAIVRTFATITGERAQAIWKRER